MRTMLLCVLALLPTVSSAMSAAEYLGHCKTQTVYDRAMCLGYLDALLNRNTQNGIKPGIGAGPLTALAATPVVDGYCLPEGTGISLLRDVVVRQLAQMPATRLATDAGGMIVVLLQRTYPPQGCTH